MIRALIKIKTVTMFVMILLVCLPLYSVTFEEGEKLSVFPDVVLSGSKFYFQIDSKGKDVTVTNTGGAKTLMVLGDSTGSSEFEIGVNGTIDYDAFITLFKSNTDVYVVLSKNNDVVAKADFKKIDRVEFISRIDKMSSAAYYVGGLGPAGGYIFYDKGEYSDGWRYLEAAPANLRVIAGVPSVDTSDVWYDFAERKYVFGEYRSSSTGKPLYVNGTEKYNENDCTLSSIGAGKTNTEMLVSVMGDSAYVSDNETTALYAAKLCFDLVYNGFDDWFLPSRDELDLMYTYICKAGIDKKSFEENDFIPAFWSSSERKDWAGGAYMQRFASPGFKMDDSRGSVNKIRPARAF